MFSLVFIEQDLMSSGRRHSLVPTERVLGQRTVVVLALGIHSHLEPWGVTERGILDVATTDKKEGMRAPVTQTGYAVGWPLQSWSMDSLLTKCL